MRTIILIFIAAALANSCWQKYKAEKIAAYQAQHGGDVCEVNNVLIGVDCRPFTREELEVKAEGEALQRWNDRVADAEARRRVAQQMEDILVYGK